MRPSTRRLLVQTVVLSALTLSAAFVAGKAPVRPSVVQDVPTQRSWSVMATAPKAAGLGSAATKTVWTCDKCHSPQSWLAIPQRVAFDHDRTGVPLNGAHKKAPCAGCHTRHPTKNGRNPTRFVPRDCGSCHTDTHRGEQGNQCQTCHTSGSWQTPRIFPRHENTRFPLTGAHAAVDCRSCHRSQARDQYSGTPTTCDGCHKKQALRVKHFPHGGLNPGCNSCHSTFSWAPARFDHGSFWPLLGAHAAIGSDCAKCHTTKNYAAAQPNCASCHGKLVDAGVTNPDHKALGFSRTCDKCHTPVAWSALKNGWHDSSFPISNGPHQRYRNTCTSCHPSGMAKGKFDCIHCHDGEHDKNKMDNEHNGEAGYVWDNKACLSCHPNGQAD